MARGDSWLERIDDGLARLPFVRGRRTEPLPITLDRKRIYVLPTRLGLLVGVLVLGMLLGGLNYNNNPALMLAFLLAAVVHNGVVMAHLRLSGLRITGIHADLVHAGEALPLRLRLHTGQRTREGVQLRANDGHVCDLAGNAEQPGADVDVVLVTTAARRGLLELGRIRIASTRPLGLARAWSWWRPTWRPLVYPALEAKAPPLPEGGTGGAGKPRPRRQGEDTHHLRDYRTGDAPRQIAWKASARLDRLVVREYETQSAHDVHLDWRSLHALPYEQRISRLARWVVEADRDGRRYRLSLPGQHFGPARGPEHRHACLRALALLPESR